MIPTEHLTVGGATSAAIALIGSVFNAIRYMEEHPFLCQSFACLFYWSFTSLLFLEAALALNRWAAVCTRKFRFKLWGSWVALGISWLGAIFVFLPAATNTWGRAGWDESSRTCTIFSSSHSTSVPFSVLIASVVFAPFFVIIMCYIAIVCTLKASHKRLDTSPPRSFALTVGDNSNGDFERRRKEQGLTLLVCAILTNYLVCTVPAATVLAVDPSAKMLSKAHIPTYIISWLGVVINPLLYVLCNPTYRAPFYARFNYSENL